VTTTDVLEVRQRSTFEPQTERKGTWVALAAAVPAVLYFLFVLHYSVNVPWSLDDWSIIFVVDAALHGHFSLSLLWTQYGDRRLVVSRLIFIVFSSIDNLNERSVMMFSAIIFAVSYALVLRMFRSYLRRPLTIVSVVAIGIVWFSLADFLNILWSFQLSWFLVTFFFVGMAYALIMQSSPRIPWLLVGMICAVAGSLSDVQGFILWPIGLVCLLWNRSWSPRRAGEVAAWLVTAGITSAIYFRGYNGDVQCVPTSSCSLGFELHHVVLLAKCFLMLVGGVFPTYGSWSVFDAYAYTGQDAGLHQFIGAGLLIAAIYVVIQSIRQRRYQSNPLPVLLIAYGLLFDLLITRSRVGEGIGQFTSGQYVMPNLVLLVGIVVYIWAHFPPLAERRGTIPTRRWLGVVGAAALTLLLAVQCVLGTMYGIAGGRARHQGAVTDARVLVNHYRLSDTQWACETAVAVMLWTSPQLATSYFDHAIPLALRDGLSLFQSDVAEYRREGPPRISECDTKARGAYGAG